MKMYVANTSENDISFLSMKSIECRSSPESIQKFVVPEDIFDAVVNPEL